MKKITLFLFGLFLSILSFSQTKPDIIILNNYNSIETSVGRELNYAADLSSSASVCYILGTGTILTSYYMDYINPNQSIEDRKQTKDILYGVGGGLILIGAFCQLSANVHLKTAGMIIDVQTSKNGVGVKIRINK